MMKESVADQGTYYFSAINVLADTGTDIAEISMSRALFAFHLPAVASAHRSLTDVSFNCDIFTVLPLEVHPKFPS